MNPIQPIVLSMLAFVLSACTGVAGHVDTDQGNTQVCSAKKDVGNSSNNAKVIAAVLGLDPNASIVRIERTGLPGLHEVLFRTGAGVDELTYISSDGRYMVNGEMIDLSAGESLSLKSVLNRRVELVRAASRTAVLYPAKAGNERTSTQTVYVFTDTECASCAEFNAAVPELNQAGVNVAFLAFPPQGLDGAGYGELTGVMCSADRRKALADSFVSVIEADAKCADTVSRHYETGLRLGVTTLPTLVSGSGIQVSGFPGTETLLASLELAAASQSEGDDVEG